MEKQKQISRQTCRLTVAYFMAWQAHCHGKQQRVQFLTNTKLLFEAKKLL